MLGVLIGSLCAGMDKRHSTARSALFSNAPFALRGKISWAYFCVLCPLDVVELRRYQTATTWINTIASTDVLW